ncbi:ankyrin repeat domain-containing protein 34B isoform X2 [Pseudorca crassidens]|uniref:ankyrin repeat domain-containing protein 34B isoform X2 n=1 Tax=Pseudorca crassidens TaxID=82174 RepID=UPI00352D551F
MGGGRILVGTEGGASEATLWPPGPPPTPAAQPRTGASLPTETPCSPGVWRGARLLAPARTLRRSGSDARISPPSGGWGYGGTYRDLRLEPPRSRRRPHPRPDGAPGPQARRVQAKPGRREAHRRLDSASQRLGLAPSPLSGKAEPARTVKTLPESSAG